MSKYVALNTNKFNLVLFTTMLSAVLARPVKIILKVQFDINIATSHTIFNKVFSYIIEFYWFSTF